MPLIPTGPDLRGSPFIIAQELGQNPTDASGFGPTLYSRLTEYWDQRAAKDLVQPGLRKLYAKRDAVEWLEGQYAALVDAAAADEKQSLGDIFTHYRTLRQDLQTEILAVESRGMGMRAGAVGELTRKTPIDLHEPVPATTVADPNDRVYRGDPLFRRTTRW